MQSEKNLLGIVKGSVVATLRYSFGSNAATSFRVSAAECQPQRGV